jgi:purine-binding chemotaxis protein CheW
VERVIRAAEVTPLPLTPPIILGALNVSGDVLPVFNLRQRFGLRDRPIGPDDQFLVAYTPHRPVALVIDAALGIIEKPLSAVVTPWKKVSDLPPLRGVMPLEDGVLLIQDLEKFLTPEESLALDAAMDAQHTNPDTSQGMSEGVTQDASHEG